MGEVAISTRGLKIGDEAVIRRGGLAVKVVGKSWGGVYVETPMGTVWNEPLTRLTHMDGSDITGGEREKLTGCRCWDESRSVRHGCPDRDEALCGAKKVSK